MHRLVDRGKVEGKERIEVEEEEEEEETWWGATRRWDISFCPARIDKSLLPTRSTVRARGGGGGGGFLEKARVSWRRKVNDEWRGEEK